eukprot:COSAG03_NODE_705_length_6186_cov_3.663217_7_plen_112_part_00
MGVRIEARRLLLLPEAKRRVTLEVARQEWCAIYSHPPDCFGFGGASSKRCGEHSGEHSGEHRGAETLFVPDALFVTHFPSRCSRRTRRDVLPRTQLTTLVRFDIFKYTLAL